MSDPQILVLNNGGQLTSKIPQVLGEEGHRAGVLNPDPDKVNGWLAKHETKCIILSGGWASVYEQDAPALPEGLLKIRRKDGSPMPILGICYGMQRMAHELGGKVVRASSGYGPGTIERSCTSALFRDTPAIQNVWESHGDSVVELPRGFRVIAVSASSQGIAAIESLEHMWWGVQFHPSASSLSRYPSQ